jgi:hypothetical protein
MSNSVIIVGASVLALIYFLGYKTDYKSVNDILTYQLPTTQQIKDNIYDGVPYPPQIAQGSSNPANDKQGYHPNYANQGPIIVMPIPKPPGIASGVRSSRF